MKYVILPILVVFSFLLVPRLLGNFAPSQKVHLRVATWCGLLGWVALPLIMISGGAQGGWLFPSLLYIICDFGSFNYPLFYGLIAFTIGYWGSRFAQKLRIPSDDSRPPQAAKSGAGDWLVTFVVFLPLLVCLSMLVDLEVKEKYRFPSLQPTLKEGQRLRRKVFGFTSLEKESVAHDDKATPSELESLYLSLDPYADFYFEQYSDRGQLLLGLACNPNTPPYIREEIAHLPPIEFKCGEYKVTYAPNEKLSAAIRAKYKNTNWKFSREDWNLYGAILSNYHTPKDVLEDAIFQALKKKPSHNYYYLGAFFSNKNVSSKLLEEVYDRIPFGEMHSSVIPALSSNPNISATLVDKLIEKSVNPIIDVGGLLDNPRVSEAALIKLFQIRTGAVPARRYVAISNNIIHQKSISCEVVRTIAKTNTDETVIKNAKLILDNHCRPKDGIPLSEVQ